MGQRWHLTDDTQWRNFCDFRNNHKLAQKRLTVEILPEKRTLDQNSMINALYGQVASQAEDLAVIDVRRYCKLHYGIPLLRANSVTFNQFYVAAIIGMEYEQKIMLMDYMDVTSAKEFSVKMGTEYIDTIIREYSKQGYSLLHPSEEAA